MSHAERCPVCNGSGKVKTGDLYSTIGLYEFLPCHGCGGCGWVTVQDQFYSSCTCHLKGRTTGTEICLVHG